MNTKLIELFNAAIPEKSAMSFAAINAEAIQRGYIVEPDACTDSVYQYLRNITINPNATFYKTWEDVTSKTRFELLIDQIFHYMTTYGTDFSCGNGYVPNDGEIDIQTTFTKFKVIKAISKKELYDRCFNMLTSGIALKQETMEVVADYVINFAAANNIDVNVDDIKNREALVYICEKLHIYPSEPLALFRYIIYVTTGRTMIIKNSEMINAIKTSVMPFDFTLLNAKQLQGLASIFLRFKDLFLAFKHVNQQNIDKLQCNCNNKYNCNNIDKLKQMAVGCTGNASVINKLRKMAKIYHKPLQSAFWNNVLGIEFTDEEIIKQLPNITPYKKVALMQACIERSYGKKDQFYLVRNQKAYVRCDHDAKETSELYRKRLYAILRASLVEDLKKHANKEVITINENGEKIVNTVPVTVKTSAGMTVSLPTSEKSFIGNYPFGTTFDMANADSYIGVYWKNDWGVHDYDLSFIDIDGDKVGWNGDFYTNNQKIVHSGDMTNAEPEATEILSMSGGCPLGIVKVNKYDHTDIKEGMKYRLFFGNQPMAKMTKKQAKIQSYYGSGYKTYYMVDPATIRLNVEIPVFQNENQVALVNGTKAVLMDIRTGNVNVSYCENAYSAAAIKSLLIKSECFIDAEPILKDAGFTIVDETFTGNVDIDFYNLDKDSLISIMA